MTDLGVGLLLCMGPSLFFLAWFYFRSQYGRASAAPLVMVFLGGLIAGPVSLLTFHLLTLIPFYRDLTGIYQAPPDVQFAWCLFAIGPVEELTKFVVVWALVFRRSWFAVPLDGLVYSAAAGLGFASVENWYYLMENDTILWARAVTLPFNHVLFSSFWGVGLSFGKFGSPARRTQMVIIGLLLASVFHGVYDYILVAENVPDLMILPLVLVLWIWVSAVHGRMKGRTNLDAMSLRKRAGDEGSDPH
ncbi:MAG: hypothetical protein AMXMBFR64_10110 [Myxococcales bacterium]